MSTKQPKNARSGQKANVAQGAPETKTAHPANPPAPDAPVAPESAQVAKRGKRPKDGNATLGELSAAFLRHLEDEGKSAGTQFSYSMDLKAATEHFGEDTPIASLTTTKVSNFFSCAGVTQKKNGKRRSAITISKTRRVFRQALLWAAERRLIAIAPIPADELEHARGVKAGKEPTKPARTKKAATKKTVEAPADASAPGPAPAVTTE